MKTVVYLGPACDGASANAALTADFRPPARRGDIEAAVSEGAQCIILLEGQLVYDYPPSPMEIYGALRADVRVYGSASLGALRAVELRHEGMRGSGWVYHRFLDQTLDADDELVALYDPETYRPLTIPLIRVRYAVEQMVHQGLLSVTTAAQLLSRLRSIYFEERSTKQVGLCAMEIGLEPALIDLLFADCYDIKRLDTLACLRIVASDNSYV